MPGQGPAGIGVQFQLSHIGAHIMYLVPGSPASRATELEVGDVITEIEGEPVVHKSCEDVVRLLTGKEHSQVKLCCLRLQTNRSTTVTLAREIYFPAAT